MRRLTLFLIPLLAAAPAVHSQSKKLAAAAPTFGNADAITQEELKNYLYFLASDPMEGRNLPSRGFDTAALYIASRLAEWGLKPGGSASGTTGPLEPYLMRFELVTKRVHVESTKASLTAPAPRGGRGGGEGRGEVRGRAGKMVFAVNS
jgi:hypothetical protein